MNFNKLISLTLVGVLMITSSAFGQDNQAPQAYVNLPSVIDPMKFGVDQPSGYVGIGVWKANPLAPAVSAWNPNDPNSLPTGWSVTGNYLAQKKAKSFCYSLYCTDEASGSMLLTNPYFNTTERNIKLGMGLAQNFRPDSSCEFVAPGTSLDDLQDATNIAACYQDRNSAENKSNTNDYELFQKDLRVCGCLRDIADNGNTAVKDIMDRGLDELRQVQNGDSKSEKASEDEKFQNFKDNAMRVRARMNQNSDAMAFQASVFSTLNGKEVKGDAIDTFASAYATNPLGKPTDILAPKTDFRWFDIKAKGRAAVLAGTDAAARASSGAVGGASGDNIIIQGVRRGAEALAEIVSASQPTDADKEAAAMTKDEIARADKVNQVLNDMAQPYKANRTLFEPNDIKPPQGSEPGQCVSAREFMAFKQIPSDDKTIKEIKEDKGDEDQWNHKILRAEYDRIMRLPMDQRATQKNRIISLKTRLQFLERNPLMKNFLAADASNLPTFFGMVPTPNQAEVRKSYEADEANGVPDLKTRKKALVDMIRRLVPANGCSTPQCMYDRMQSPDMKKVSGDILKFFANPANATVTTTENTKANTFLANDFFAKKENLTTKAPELYTRENVDNAFARYYNLGSPKDCDGESKLDVCVRTYSGYCKYLDNQFPKITDQLITDREIVDDLDNTVSNFFNTDIKTNKDLKDFNDSICNTPRRKSLSQQDGNYKTFWQYRAEACKSKPAGYCDTVEGMQAVRTEYLENNPEPAVPGTGIASVHVKGFNALMKGSGIGRGMNRATIAQMESGGGPTGGSMAAYLEQLNRDMGYEENIFEDSSTSSIAQMNKSSADFTSNFDEKSAKVDNKIDNSTPIDDVPSMGSTYNYSAGASTANGSTVAGTEQVQKVENMSDPQRQELMDDWQKEYDAWKRSKDNDGSAAASSKDAAMQARIDALEQLLAQQKKLTEDQYKLINEAIANQNRAQTAVAQSQDNQSSGSTSNGRNRSVASVSGSVDDEEVSTRTGGGASEVRQANGGVGGGAGSAGIGSGGSSSSRRAALSGGSSDDVAREEAKLVSMRSSADGSIVISAVNTNGGGANAISVPVSDDQYRALQANPQSLNLSQIESRIPKDQIAKLEKEGEIVILLRNGSNPPFEVKVEKKNNKLVYSLKDKKGNDQAPVRRIAKYEWLLNTTKQMKTK